MDKTLKSLRDTLKPPSDVIKAIKKVEEWTSSQTDRDDWAIGGLACRKGFERLLKMYRGKK